MFKLIITNHLNSRNVYIEIGKKERMKMKDVKYEMHKLMGKKNEIKFDKWKDQWRWVREN